MDDNVIMGGADEDLDEEDQEDQEDQTVRKWWEKAEGKKKVRDEELEEHRCPVKHWCLYVMQVLLHNVGSSRQKTEVSDEEDEEDREEAGNGVDLPAKPPLSKKACKSIPYHTPTSSSFRQSMLPSSAPACSTCVGKCITHSQWNVCVQGLLVTRPRSQVHQCSTLPPAAKRAWAASQCQSLSPLRTIIVKYKFLPHTVMITNKPLHSASVWSTCWPVQGPLLLLLPAQSCPNCAHQW